MAYPDDLPTCTDGSLGRTKVNTSAYTANAASADASEYNEIKLSVEGLAAVLGLPGAFASSDLGVAIAGGELTNPSEISTSTLLPDGSSVIVLRGLIYGGLKAQTVATSRLLLVTDGVGIVPFGYPSSTQSINGVLNTFVTLEPGLHVLTGDGALDWAVFPASAEPKKDYSGSNGPPIGTDDSTQGYAKGSERIDSAGDVWKCTDATPTSALWVKLN